MWVAQGRVRAAIQVSTGNRIHAEDVTFNSVDPNFNEKLVAVEYDEANTRLFTLTGRALYAENMTAGVPSSRVSYDLTPLLTWTNSAPVDVKFWPGTPFVFVLTSKSILVMVDNGTAGFTFQSAANELANETSGFLTDATGTIDSFKFALYDTFELAEDANGRVMAYVRARMGGFGGKPAPRGLVLCDLDSPGGFLTPTFNADLATGGRRFAFWTPIPCLPGSGTCNGNPAYEYTINDVQVVGSGSGPRTAYMACGPQSQIRRVNVTNGFTQPLTLIDHFKLPGNPEVMRLEVDPTNANRLLAVSTYNYHIVTLPNGTPTSLPGIERFTVGLEGPHDALLMSMPGRPLVEWTLGSYDVDYALKTVDWTGATPSLVYERFQMHRSDGGVMIPPNDVYLPTISGVVRYNRSPSGTWEAIDASYQPNETAPGVGDSSITEHIAIGSNVPVGPVRIVTAAVKQGFAGSFDEWLIDPVTKNIGPVTRYWFNPVTQSGVPQWTGGGFYGNDVAFVTIQGQNFLLTDVAQFDLNEAALVAWRWDTTGNVWKPIATAWWAGGTPIAPNFEFLTDTIHVDTSNAIPYAFVTDTCGFTVIDLAGLTTSSPKMIVRDRVDTGSVSSVASSAHYAPSIPFKQCRGLVTAGTQVFACLRESTQPGGPGAQMSSWTWNPATGLVGGHTASITSTAVASSPTNPNGDWSATYRCRFLPLSATGDCGLIYVCTEASLLEFGYSPTNGLTYRTYWKSDYSAPIQDALPYVIGGRQRILVSKDQETFAIVVPSTTTCP
ncbi:MAG: hypothetical protein IT453_16100 [Planctomycetes bacterium]|nr:hypothetical protein [Planctomycetota bacterium]